MADHEISTFQTTFDVCISAAFDKLPNIANISTVVISCSSSFYHYEVSVPITSPTDVLCAPFTISSSNSRGTGKRSPWMTDRGMYRHTPTMRFPDGAGVLRSHGRTAWPGLSFIDMFGRKMIRVAECSSYTTMRPIYHPTTRECPIGNTMELIFTLNHLWKPKRGPRGIRYYAAGSLQIHKDATRQKAG